MEEEALNIAFSKGNTLTGEERTVSRPIGGVLSTSASRSCVAIHLSGPPGESGEPDGRAALLPRLTLLRVGFTEPPQLPVMLVRSYRTVSPLPVPEGHRRSVLCGTFLRVTSTHVS